MKNCTVCKFITALLFVGCAVTTPLAQGGSVGAKHNLNVIMSDPVSVANAFINNEYCISCHTLNLSNQPSTVLLWNQSLSTNTTYITGGLGRKAGTTSLACLSCHDGSQAVDNIINSPSSRGGSVLMIGVGSADHPIGVEYCGGPVNGVIGTCKDPDYVLPTTGRDGNTSTNSWWVDTSDGMPGVRENTDMILYASPSNSGGQSIYVECATCHDPHSNSPLFLRRVQGNRNSVTCLSCHVK